MIGSQLHTFLFSQVFGLYFVILAIIFLSRAEYYRAMIPKLKAPAPGTAMIASLSLFIGLILVTVHNIWVFQPRVLVTILCWLFLIKSILWLAAPERMLKIAQKMWSSNGHYFCSVTMLVVGVFMMIRGFYLFMQSSGGFPMTVIS